jgi:cytochrome b
MNTMSASPAEPQTEPQAAAAAERRIPVLIWDAPVRVFHWLTVLSFAWAFLTAESERWRLVHVTLGYTLAALVAWRLIWGLIGTRHARFAGFVRGPRAALRYLGSLWRGRPEHHPGHNPAGALAIVALLATAALVSVTGFMRFEDLGGEWVEHLHEALANGLLALVGLHVAGVVFGSLAHRENLVRAMFSGRKPARPDQAIRRAWSGVAALMLVAVLGFWAWQGTQAPPASAVAGARAGDHEDD